MGATLWRSKSEFMCLKIEDGKERSASGGRLGMRFQSTVFLNKTLSMNSFSIVLSMV